MVLKLYGNPISSAAFRVITVLHEKHIPYEIINVDFATAEHKSPGYMAKQPFGQLPCIDDNGFILYESRAICRYLCEKYPPQGAQLVPKGDAQAIALFEQMASVEMANFDVPAAQLLQQKYYHPLFNQPIDEEAASRASEKLNATLSVYDSILDKQQYLAGDQLTLVDIFHLPCGRLLEAIGYLSLEDRPNVARWWKEISSHPSWLAANFQPVKRGI